MMSEDKRGVMAWFAGNSVAANMLMIALVAIGAIMVMTMKTEVFPEIDPRTVTVSVTYSGANPEEVEQSINRRVESALTGLSGIKRVTSSASEGQGTVTAELTSIANPDAVLVDVRDAVDKIADFPPEEAEDPVVEKSTLEPELLTLALFGDVRAGEQQLRQTAERLRSELLATNQLADVALGGVRAFEISIEVSEEALQRYNLTIENIGQKITAASVDIAGGTLRTTAGEILLRTAAKRTSAEGFGAIPIVTQQDGATVLLSDIARITDGYADGDLVNTFNGTSSIFITVYRSADQGVIDAEDVVRAYLEDVSIPPGMSLEIRDNDTDQLRDRINLMVRNAIFGFGLVVLTLVLFLDLKLAFWTGLAIPISFLGGLAIAGAMGASINMISLFALILVLGIVVDDAVVIGENIFDTQSKGGDPADAALRGLREVAAPVTVGVMTTILAFFPLLFTTGTLGQIVGVVPVVVIAILAISLVEGLLILPAHLSHGGPWSTGPMGWVQSGFSGALNRFTKKVVSPLVWVAVQFRYATMTLIAAIIFISVTALTTGFLSFVFLPPTEGDSVDLVITLPEGAPFSETQAAAEAAMRAAGIVSDQVEELDGVSPVRTTSATIGQASTGSAGPGASSYATQSNVAQVRVDLTSSDNRSVGSSEFEKMWRETLGTIPNVESLAFSSGLFSLGDDISFDLSLADDDLLLAAAEALRTQLGSINGVYDIQFSLQYGKRQLEFALNETGVALGLSDGDLARQIRRAFFGETVQTLQRGLDEVPVVVRYPQDARSSLSDVYNMRISLPGGSNVPISAVAHITETRSFSTIERANGQRVLTVTAKVDSSVSNADAVNSELIDTFLPGLSAEYPGLVWSQSGQSVEQSEDLLNIFIAFGCAMLMIFVMLAAFTRSYILPIVILSTVVYGVVGAIVGHVALGYPMTFISVFGIVALSGVVINDTILLLDDYRRRMERDATQSKHQAFVESAARRFRPILMTTLSTAIGLFPMIFETSVQAKFLVPMAISLGFGILVATPILLLAIPATVIILDDLGRPVRWFKRRSANAVDGKSEVGTAA